jgi:uncharacterized protein (DUF1684 family)
MRLKMAPVMLALTYLWSCKPAPIDTVVDQAYRSEIESWRARRDERLRTPDGWLTLVGLFWFEPGDNSFGSASDNDFVFPETAPAHAGVLTFEDGAVTLTPSPGVIITCNDDVVTRLTMVSDRDSKPTIARMGTISFFVIERGGDLGVRVKDSESPVLKSFAGIESFPIDPRWRIQGHFEAYDPPKVMSVPNALGSYFDEQCAGAFVFELDGETHRIDAISEVSKDLFLVFSDRTNGVSTYGGGRFVYADEPTADGTVLVDFNMAHNPPCAFTRFATCPLPPPQNKLDLAVEAGEKAWGDGLHH